MQNRDFGKQFVAQQNFTHPVVAGDTTTSIAADLTAQINANVVLPTWLCSATNSGPVINLISFNPEPQEYAVSVNGVVGSETMVVSAVRNGTVQLSNNEYNKYAL